MHQANERLQAQAEELRPRAGRTSVERGTGATSQERTAELARANTTLRQAGAYNRSLIEASLDPLVTIGPDGRITDANRATEEVTGCLRAELIGSDFSQYFTEPQKADEGYRKVFREGSVQDYPLEIRRKDGRITSVLYNAAVYRDDAVEAAGVFAAARDVTELHRAEQAVRAERQRLNDVLEMLPAYLVLLTPDYHVPFANRFFRERFGESHGKRCFEYLFNRTEPCEICETYKVLETHAPHHWEWTGPDGRIYDIHDFPFTDTDGSPLIMEMGIDITERKLAEERLEAGQRDAGAARGRAHGGYAGGEQAPPDTNRAVAGHQRGTQRPGRRTATQEEDLRTANEELHRAKELSDSLNRINETLHSTLDFGEVMQRLLAEGAAVLGSETATVSLRQGEGWIVSHVHNLPAHVVGARMADGEERHAMLAIQSGRPVAVADALTDARVNREHLRKYDIRTLLTVPLITRGEPVGIIFFNYHAGPRIFTDAETNFAQQLAATAAIALENASLFGERTRAEEALRRSEERFRNVFANAATGIVIADKSRQYLAVNDRFCEITGYSREQLLTMGCGEIIHPDDQGLDIAEIERLFRREASSFICDMRYIHANGSIVWVCLNVSLLCGNGPESPGLIGVATDITWRKRAEQALREGEERYRSLFNGMTEGFGLHEMIFDSEGRPCDYRFLDVNPAFEQLTGLRREDILGRTVRDILPENEPFWIETFGRVVQTGEPANFEQYSTPLNRWYEIFAYRPAENQFATVFLDISERKDAELKIVRQTAILRGISRIFQEALSTGPRRNWAESAWPWPRRSRRAHSGSSERSTLRGSKTSPSATRAGTPAPR